MELKGQVSSTVLLELCSTIGLDCGLTPKKIGCVCYIMLEAIVDVTN